jgi:hypothetical protein
MNNLDGWYGEFTLARIVDIGKAETTARETLASVFSRISKTRSTLTLDSIRWLMLW